MTEEVKPATETEPWWKKLLTPQALSAFIALFTAIGGIVSVLKSSEVAKQLKKLTERK